MRIYLDTNVIMDFLLHRRSSAYELIKKTLSCMHEIVISDIVLIELRVQKIDCESLMKILDSVHKLEIVITNTDDKINVRQIVNAPHNDALHYLLAKRANVECLVTSNIKDFYIFKDLMIRRPDDL